MELPIQNSTVTLNAETKNKSRDEVGTETRRIREGEDSAQPLSGAKHLGFFSSLPAHQSVLDKKVVEEVEGSKRVADGNIKHPTDAAIETRASRKQDERNSIDKRLKRNKKVG